MPIIPLVKETGNLSVLLQGPPGTGKTTLAVEIAECLKRKSLFLDYDRKLSTQTNLTDKQASKIDVWTPPKDESPLALIDKGKPSPNPNSYLEVIDLINKLDPFPYDMTCLDAMTNFSEDMEAFWSKRLSFHQGSKGDASYAFWNNVGSNLMGFIQGLKKLPCLLIVNVHTQEEKDEITGAIKTTPTISSKKRYIIGKEFDEAYVLQGSNGKDFTALVVGNNRYVARTGLPITKPVATLKEIKEALVKHVVR